MTEQDQPEQPQENLPEHFDADKSLDKAISEALTGYAKDGGTWLLAKHNFYQALQGGSSPMDALTIALNTAQDGAESKPDDAIDRFYRNIDTSKISPDSPNFAGRQYGVSISAVDRETGRGPKLTIGVGGKAPGVEPRTFRGRRYGIQIGERALGFGPRVKQSSES
ncbi:MAG: hypothetical protein WAO28_02950 [Candidatus Microsaccharimonas sp.]